MPRQRLAQRADGRFRCKYKNRYFYGATQAEALAKRSEYIRAQKQGTARLSKNTFAGYASAWLPTAKPDVRTHTYNNYAHLIDIASQRFGKKLLSDVTPTDIRSFLNEYHSRSSGWIMRTLGLLRSIFDAACDDGLCTRNPARSNSAVVKNDKAGTHRAITEEQRELIHNSQHEMRTFAMVMLYAGLSRSEAWGINLDEDVDLQNRIIYVRGAVHVEGKFVVYEERAKNKYRLRAVPIFDPLLQELKGKHGLLTSTIKETGGYLTEQAMHYRWRKFNDALSEAAGHEIRIRMHDLRHSFCAWCRDAGVDESMVASWMGHTDSKMVRLVYDHISAERRQKAVDLVNKNGSRGQNGGQAK